MTAGARAPDNLLLELRGAVHDAARDASWLQDALAKDGPALLATCRALTRGSGDADDLLQETLLRALTRPPADRDRPLLPWLKAVARNLAVDAHRARSELPDDGAVEAASDEAPPDHHADGRERVDAALVEAVAQLGLGQLAVFLLRTLLDLSADEAAEAVGKSAGNVRVLTHRARDAIRSGSAISEATRRAAVAQFLETVCAADMTGLHDLLRHVRDDQGPGGALGGLLQSKAASRAWARLICAAGAVLHDTDTDAAPVAKWCQAVALEAAGDPGTQHAFQRALAASRERGLDALSARTLLVLARHAIRRGDTTGYDAARRAAAELDDAVADPSGIHRGTLTGSRLWRRGDFAAATDVYDRMLADERPSVQRAALLHNLALMGAYSGALAPARERCLQALDLHRASGDRILEGTGLNVLGMIDQNLGALAEAEASFRQALAVLPGDAHDKRAGVHTNLGLVAHERGDLALAIERFHRGHTLATTAGRTRSQAIALANLGVTHHAAGRHAAARRALREATAALQGMDTPHLGAFVQAHLAAVEAREDPDAAAAMLAESRATFEELGDRRMLGLVDLLEGWVRLCAEPGPEALAEVEARLRAVRQPGPDSTPPLIRQLVVVRIGADLVRRASLQRATDTRTGQRVARRTRSAGANRPALPR